jgi:hypothetical protein
VTVYVPISWPSHYSIIFSSTGNQETVFNLVRGHATVELLVCVRYVLRGGFASIPMHGRVDKGNVSPDASEGLPSASATFGISSHTETNFPEFERRK